MPQNHHPLNDMNSSKYTQSSFAMSVGEGQGMVFGNKDKYGLKKNEGYFPVIKRLGQQIVT